MIVFNYVVCAVLLAGLIWEVCLILRRNRTILLKGKDDYFTFCLVVLFVVIIFPFSNVAGIVESIRNILLLILVMGSAGIRRGFSEKGLEKVCYTIAWSDIQKVYVNEYQSAKIQVICQGKKMKHKLLFTRPQLPEVLRVVEKRVSEIYIQSTLQQDIKKPKTKRK
ncbi:MAG TPA: hypothetical protein IAB52_08670 [Candidatus Scatomonas merdavium]|nr:hypothetical protein [Candidatus Scatomonas merdavium]